MTTYHTIIVNKDNVKEIVTDDEDYSDDLEHKLRANGYSATSFGNINSKVYVVVYEHPDYKKEVKE